MSSGFSLWSILFICDHVVYIFEEHTLFSDVSFQLIFLKSGTVTLSFSDKLEWKLAERIFILYPTSSIRY